MNRKDRIVGLKNGSQYCYLIATLQCLLNITRLRDYYLKKGFERFDNIKTISNSNEYSTEIASFFGDVFRCNKESKETLNPRKLKNLFGKKFTPREQHDSYEALMDFILSVLKEETPINQNSLSSCEDYSEAYTSIIH